MDATLTLTAPPQVLCLTLDEAKLHLELSASANDHDELILSLIEAATQDAERIMQRGILSQQWLLKLDAFPASGCIILKMPQITAIGAISAADPITGAPVPVPPSSIVTDFGGEGYGRIALLSGAAWPAVRQQPAAVTVAFTAGWATPADVPQVIKSWVRLRIGALFEHREAWTLGKAIHENPFVDSLLARYRKFSF